MHYELWSHHPGNLISTFATEAEALQMVRALLESEWSAEEMSLGLEWSEGEDGDDADLPPFLQGTALAERAGVVSPPELGRISA